MGPPGWGFSAYVMRASTDSGRKSRRGEREGWGGCLSRAERLHRIQRPMATRWCRPLVPRSRTSQAINVNKTDAFGGIRWVIQIWPDQAAPCWRHSLSQPGGHCSRYVWSHCSGIATNIPPTSIFCVCKLGKPEMPRGSPVGAPPQVTKSPCPLVSAVRCSRHQLPPGRVGVRRRVPHPNPRCFRSRRG